MKIALCITDLDVGGAERCLVNLALGLSRDQFEPVVYCLGPRPEREEASCVPPLEEAGIAVHCLGATSARNFLSCRKRLTGLLRRQKPDLIQTLLFHANVIGRMAAHRAGVPHVVSGIRVAEREARWHLWLDRITARKTDHHVCVSEDVARFTREKVGYKPESISVIPNGIDVTQYPAAKKADLGEFGITPDDRIVTFVGRLTEQKGLDWLLETGPQWLTQASRGHLVMVGAGAQREPLEATSRRLGLADRVHFLGWRPDVPEILAASDVLILPSRWEGMPNVVLQAMATGLPVLATDVEGVRELLGPHAQSQTVPFGETQTLVEKILAILDDASLADDLGQRNARRVAAEFSLSAMISAYEDLWTHLARP